MRSWTRREKRMTMSLAPCLLSPTMMTTIGLVMDQATRRAPPRPTSQRMPALPGRTSLRDDLSHLAAPLQVSFKLVITRIYLFFLSIKVRDYCLRLRYPT
ncbi:Uncharacterized protein M6B38_239770 [Iris pallida]|uniref:Secreted protein n=1 Tax=Iris pallida TaxID=29817 RepID=A0AAX6DKM2_IRIPA|nr:Uncharacterized protein M6B38_239770 [Iris pallida]